MSVMQISRVACKQETGDEMARVLDELLPGFAAEPGVLTAAAYRCVEEPLKFTLFIEWESIEHHERWRESTTDFRAKWRATVPPLLEVPNVSAHYTRI